MKLVKNMFGRAGVAVTAATTAIAAHAAPDYSGITGAIDWSTALTAVGSVFAGVAGVYMLIKGGKIILGVVKGTAAKISPQQTSAEV